MNNFLLNAYEENRNFSQSSSRQNHHSFDVAPIFNTAYLKGASPMNAISGFRVSGIWPYNRNVFQDCDFAPVSVTNEPPVNIQSPAGVNVQPYSAENTLTSHHVASENKDSPIPSTSFQVPQHKTPPPTPSVESDEGTLTSAVCGTLTTVDMQSKASNVLT
ncbi:unnamed protein product [Euphydryas editha]|uniref:Uncharacterized protein n=1 Tax=Euphydryas editha TaxID=104508 RepID=A0AAU9USV9_EUPED|nr:unnamed protein product [Euphydryas editha]